MDISSNSKRLVTCRARPRWFFSEKSRCGSWILAPFGSGLRILALFGSGSRVILENIKNNFRKKISFTKCRYQHNLILKNKMSLNIFLLSWVSELWIYILNLAPFNLYFIPYLHVWIRVRYTDPDPESSWIRIQYCVTLLPREQSKTVNNDIFLKYYNF